MIKPKKVEHGQIRLCRSFGDVYQVIKHKNRFYMKYQDEPLEECLKEPVKKSVMDLDPILPEYDFYNQLRNLK